MPAPTPPDGTNLEIVDLLVGIAADLTRVIDQLRRSGKVAGTKTLIVLGTESGGRLPA